MFTLLLSLWMTGALLLPLHWGTAFGNDEYEEATPTPDYDYNSTYEYYTYNGSDVNINYDVYEVLHDVRKEENKASVPVYRLYGILAGLLVLQIFQ